MSAPAGAPSSGRLQNAYAECERLARAHYENFPVASRLLPAAMRPHIAAIYAFARTADDFADEPGMSDDERLRRLDEWGRRLRGLAPAESDLGPGPLPAESDLGPGPLFLALHNTIREHRLPVTLFEDLLSAFRQDVTTKRYPTWADVLDYCRRSANPVGRLVLRVAGYESAGLDEASDSVCTALQLTNFWQDLERDWINGRLYVPLEERDRAAARDADLEARQMTPEWRNALRSAADRTRELYRAGRAVCDRVGGRLRWELRFTWLGGMRILDKLEAVEFDVFNRRPKLGAGDAPALLWRALVWRRSQREVLKGADGC